jgi:hypothetical protein
MLVEKVWAKLNGNYEATVSGSSDEMFAFLAGMPNDDYSTTDAS